jgi:hypothetical protein
MKRMSGKKGAGAAVCFFSSSFEGRGVGVIVHCAFPPRSRISISLRWVIRVHSLVCEVENRVCQVGEAVVDWPSTLWGLLSPDLRGTMPCHAVSGGTARCFLAAPCGIPRRISSWVGLLCVEFPLHPPRRRWFRSKNSSWAEGDLALENDGHGVSVDRRHTPYLACQLSVFCVRPHTRGYPRGALGRTVSRIVTRWFMLGHERERQADFSRFGLL